MANQNLPQKTRVVIIGGGVIGTSVAYHLAHLGWTDVVLARAQPVDQRHDVARGGSDDHLRLDLGDLGRDADVHP